MGGQRTRDLQVACLSLEFVLLVLCHISCDLSQLGVWPDFYLKALDY